MYWPIGTPRIYAASIHELAHSKATVSEEGSQDRTELLIESPSENGTANGVDSASEKNENADSESSASISNGRKKESRVDELNRGGQEEQLGEEIVGSILSRSGNIFITI